MEQIRLSFPLTRAATVDSIEDGSLNTFGRLLIESFGGMENIMGFINSMNSQAKRRLKDGILGLAEYPPKGDIKTLQGLNDGTKRLRIGGYRVIYRVDNEQIIIDKIDTRGGVYK